MQALDRYVIKRQLTELLKQAQIQPLQSQGPKLTAAPVPQAPAVTQGVVNAGAPAPSLVPPPPGKGQPAPMIPPVPKPSAAGGITQ